MTKTNGKTQKYLVAATFLLPAAIFLFYFLAQANHHHTAIPPLTPPRLAVLAGKPVNLGGYTFLAGSPAPVFTSTIYEPGNTIMAGPNQIFVIIPVLVLKENKPAQVPGLTWQLVDSKGEAHSPLKPRNFHPQLEKGNLPAQPGYLLFEIPSGTGRSFLLLTTRWGKAAWYIGGS